MSGHSCQVFQIQWNVMYEQQICNQQTNLRRDHFYKAIAMSRRRSWRWQPAKKCLLSTSFIESLNLVAVLQSSKA